MKIRIRSATGSYQLLTGFLLSSKSLSHYPNGSTNGRALFLEICVKECDRQRCSIWRGHYEPSAIFAQIRARRFYP